MRIDAIRCSLFVLLIASAFCSAGHGGLAASSILDSKSTPLPAPTLMSPDEGAIFHHYPRHMTLTWTPVPSAREYVVEWDYYSGKGWASEGARGYSWPSSTTKKTQFSFDFVGSQPGRWRVWAIDKHGNAGTKSDWRLFTFGRVIEGSIIPPPPPPVNMSAVVQCSSPQSTTTYGAGMTQPKVIFDPEPNYSDAGSKDKINGSVGLWVNISADGLVTDVCVARSLRADMDERAIATLKTWRFEPARKDGVAFAAKLYIEVDFHVQ